MDTEEDQTTSATATQRTTIQNVQTPFVTEWALPIRLGFSEFDGANVIEWFRDTEKKLNDGGYQDPMDDFSHTGFRRHGKMTSTTITILKIELERLILGLGRIQ